MSKFGPRNFNLNQFLAQEICLILLLVGTKSWIRSIVVYHAVCVLNGLDLKGYEVRVTLAKIWVSTRFVKKSILLTLKDNESLYLELLFIRGMQMEE